MLTNNDAGSSWVTNTYAYNRRRLPVSETQTDSDRVEAWTIAYGYDGNGHVSSLGYPAGLTIDTAPNALGQPTKAGTYATGASYFPNGALQQFTYGNGIVHTLTQTIRGLPERSRDAYGSTAVHDDSLDFDGNGNVAAISDGLAGFRGDRTMNYDGLDRLTATTSPMYGAAGAHYGYDVLDNLTAVTAPSRNQTYWYDNANRLTSIKDAVSGATVMTLGFDANGNLATRYGVSYAFDAGNRLRSAGSAPHRASTLRRHMRSP